MQIHWLSCTVHAPDMVAGVVYNSFLREHFGVANVIGGSNYYRSAYSGLMGARVLYDNVSAPEVFTISLPGQACEVVGFSWFINFFDWLDGTGFDYSVTRLDVAFDDFPFTPSEMEAFSHEGNIYSLAQTTGGAWEKVKGVITRTWTLGSRTSERFVRVYDRRGVNRLEIELKHDAADTLMRHIHDRRDLPACSLLAKNAVRMFFYVKSMLGGYQSNYRWKVWEGDDTIPEYLIPSPALVSLQKTASWLKNSVSHALYVVSQVEPGFLPDLMYRGNLEHMAGRSKRYDFIMDTYRHPEQRISHIPCPPEPPEHIAWAVCGF